MKVLIGYDGSECSDDAITDLARAGLPPDATEALVYTVADVLAAPASPDPDTNALRSAAIVLRDVQRVRAMVQSLVDDARATAERGAARVRELYPRWSVQTAARADSPHWALVGKAQEWGADLVVVGSRGRASLGRLLLGSVSQQVLHHAPCSVRIGRCLPPGERPREPRVRLVLGIDGSVDSATAASAVADRHWPAGSEVLVVGVVDSRVILNCLEATPPTPRSSPSRPDTTADATSDLAQSLERVCQDLDRSGITATSAVLVGDAKTLLVQEAQRIGADCIVVGAKGHTRLERVLLGSVSASVAARAPCSVEVVRHG
jgi:nucleotide-binding universal stress UspA family protein